MLQRLPNGLSDFRGIIETKCLYVDKTKYIHRFCNSGKYYFFARPRRFGKSMTLSVLHELYSGSKELFAGLWIENNWDWTKKHPVIHLSFKDIDYVGQGLEVALSERLQKIGEDFGFILEKNTSKNLLRDLLQKTSVNGKVVVLIDEYDAPILQYLSIDTPLAQKNRDLLKEFYTTLKENDRFLELVFITGITKFAKVGLFSGLNNFQDLSMHREYTTMLGYTQTELETNFDAYIADIADEMAVTKQDILDKIKFWYNGYKFEEKAVTVYNPVSTNSFFDERKFKNFWFETGTPEYLMKHLGEHGMYKFAIESVPEAVFNSFNIEDLNTYSLLFQAGYLTIKDMDEFGDYILDYPNYEVKRSMEAYLLDTFGNLKSAQGVMLAVQIEKAFIANDIEKVVSILKTIFKNIPNHLFKNNYNEAFYHTMIHLLFSYMGIKVQSEVNTTDGRCDAIVHTTTHIYVLEFKLDQTAEAAFAQITDKQYAQAQAHKGKAVIGVGINFSDSTKTIDGHFYQTIFE
jgi:hypothetical protein